MPRALLGIGALSFLQNSGFLESLGGVGSLFGGGGGSGGMSLGGMMGGGGKISVPTATATGTLTSGEFNVTSGGNGFSPALIGLIIIAVILAAYTLRWK